MSTDLRVLALISGFSEQGAPQYAYVSMPAEQYWRFKQQPPNTGFDAAQYAGSYVVEHGSGLEPDEKMQRHVEATYNASHTLEQDLLASSDKLAHSLPKPYWQSLIGSWQSMVARVSQDGVEGVEGEEKLPARKYLDRNSWREIMKRPERHASEKASVSKK